ncbi:type III-B CRISPR module-associated protein Cmr5 [Saccharolobus islandicus]|uniref:CRISPR type III-B/RAMP module-associated protein Cmr5 n=1 Tax=Saccharolobus islandicus LAL14/1 TaxID=1241935 RepID=M9U7K5_SACIS|nr:type III-B CRISPR module-associated protein Cmr5 [Sulfolobus islandicus]AGJ62068.1 CRISPR-associated protein, Cmr5 [Sulfolobus islandicus LAL14/1]
MDYIDFVIEYGKKLEKKKEECKSLDAFIRRAEDFPSLVAQEGLVPAMTFYYSKMEGGVSSIENVECEELINEGKGYSVYLSFLIDVLREFANLKCTTPLDCIKEVRQNEIVITRKILPILVEMKKVSNIVR